MRYSYCLAALAATVAALPTEELFTIELGPGVTKKVTEAEKYKLKAEGTNFFDITEFPDAPNHLEKRQSGTFPTTLTQGTTVNALIAKISQSNLRSTLTTFSNFNNRYYRATTGKQSSDWLLSQIKALIPSGSNITATQFAHSFTQSSVIATIPGKSAKTIVVGAHQDSINQQSPTSGRAPGADDNGSGSMTILEAFRILLTDSRIASGQAPNTIEFHWYAGEEGGLLGSQAVFNNYATNKRDVRAMLNQDMTGYTQGYKDAGKTPIFGVMTDNVNSALTAFTRRLITGYTTVGYADDKCGYACSDHASATRAGFPSAIVFESEMDYDNKYIHSAQDTIDKVDFQHVADHTKLVIGFAVELGFATTV